VEGGIEIEIAETTVDPAWKLGTVAACEAKFDYDLFRCSGSVSTNVMYSENTIEAELALRYTWAIRQYVLCTTRLGFLPKSLREALSFHFGIS